MGSDRCSRGRLVARCCHGVVFGFGFVFTVLAIVVMFWIAWCYFGLAILQTSNSQRRAAAADWSNGSSKPVLPSPITASPVRSTTSISGETSSNSISKLPTTESLLRGSSRGESQVKFNKRKEAAVISSLAKGDFAERDKGTTPSDNTTAFRPKVASTVPSLRGPQKSKDELQGTSYEKASILTAYDDSEEEGIYPRRVMPPGIENRPEEKLAISNRPHLDISPTKVYGSNVNSETSRSEKPPRPSETRSSDYPDRGSIQSSRRSDSDLATTYRDPDFERESPRQSTSYVRGDSRYDDLEDERGSRGRYDKRDRGRPSDDRLSKGDTRVYPDDRDSTVDRDDRYSVRERYPDDVRRRGDDDRYYDDGPRSRDRGTRYRDRDLVDRQPPRDDRYRDDDRYRPKNDRDQDEPRYRPREEYDRPPGYDRYPAKDDDKVRPKIDDRYRYRDDDRYRYRDDDRDDEGYRVRADDGYRTRNDERFRRDPVRSDDNRDGYRPRDDSFTSRGRDTDVRESSTKDDRRQSSSRSGYDTRVDETVADYDRPRTQAKDDTNPSRPSRPSNDEDRYRERDRDRDESNRRPSRYDYEDREIVPTRTRSEYSLSKSSLIDSRPRESGDSSRYTVDERDKPKEGDYYDQDRSIRLQGSRSSSPVSESTRRYSDDNDERYRSRSPSERNDYPKGQDEKVIDRRSYASEEGDEYRRRGDSKFKDEYDDRTRRPVEEPRRYKDEESYLRRDPIDDRNRPRDDRDRSSSGDRYADRYPERDDRLLPLPIRKYDTYGDDRPMRRDTDVSTIRKDGIRDREESLRPSPSYREEQRSYSRGENTESRRRYDDDLPIPDSRDSRDDERYLRGSRKPSSNDNSQSSRLYDDDNSSSPRFHDAEPKSSEHGRPSSARGVIDEATRHSDSTDQNAKKVYYPVFDPRSSNLTSTEFIRTVDRRGSTITSKKRRSA